jgi:DNA gyrase subunit B
MKVVVHKDGGMYMQEYSKGKRKAAVKKIGSTKLHGTIVTFEPDPEIFKEGIKFEWNRIVSHMRQQAYLVKSLKISIIDAREQIPTFGSDEELFYIRETGIDALSHTFFFEGGLVSLIKFTNQLLKPAHKNIFYVERKVEGVESVEVALQYADDVSARILAFANNIHTPEGGTHITGFKTALTRTLNTYAKNNNLAKNGEETFTGDDVLEGLTAVISVKLREIQFEGQTKGKLGNSEIQPLVQQVTKEGLQTYFEAE